MKIYLDPISNSSLPILMFLAEHDSGAEIVPISLLKKENQTPEYGAINPSKYVPTLQEGDFVLTESSAILKYLAEKTRSPTYPEEKKQRARVNEVMDWFNTSLYRDLGYGVVYPQILREIYGFTNPDTQADVVRRGTEQSAVRLSILNDHWLRNGGFSCGHKLTIADYFGSSFVAAGDLVDFDISSYPNVVRWMNLVKARPSWEQTRRDWYGLITHLRAQRLGQP